VSQAAAGRAYAREFFAAMLGYVILLPISILVAQRLDPPVRVLVVLVPIIPLAFALRAYVRFLGRMDELARRIQLEALGFAFGAAGMLTLSYGFLEGVGFPELSYIWVFPLMIALWGIGTAIASRRYR
jgi:O-antigen/teichoic acid export membrane protein